MIFTIKPSKSVSLPDILVGNDRAPCPPELDMEAVLSCGVSEVRGIILADFEHSLKKIRRSVPQATLQAFHAWNAEYGDVST